MVTSGASSPEERRIIHALGDKRTLLLYLLPDLLERVLLRYCQVPKTARQRHIIWVGDAWREWGCACGCGCGHGIVTARMKVDRWCLTGSCICDCHEISKIDGDCWWSLTIERRDERRESWSNCVFVGERIDDDQMETLILNIRLSPPASPPNPHPLTKTFLYCYIQHSRNRKLSCSVARV